MFRDLVTSETTLRDIIGGEPSEMAKKKELGALDPHARSFIAKSPFLLLGTSGAGKSTSARLWAQRPGVTVLSDDRIVVRADGDDYRIYGTPWHGDAGYESPGSAPLAAVFILEQAPRNRVLDLTPASAVSQMMVRAFPAMWDQRGLDFAQ